MPPTPSWLCGGIFPSAGISPQPSLPTESVRYLPTLPVEFPKPSGNDGDLELRSRRADSHALAATTTAFAYTRFSVPADHNFARHRASDQRQLTGSHGRRK